MSLGVIVLIILVVVVLVLIPILMRVFGEAARRNPNRPGGEGQSESDEESRRRHSGPDRG